MFGKGMIGTSEGRRKNEYFCSVQRHKKWSSSEGNHVDPDLSEPRGFQNFRSSAMKNCNLRRSQLLWRERW